MRVHKNDEALREKVVSAFILHSAHLDGGMTVLPGNKLKFLIKQKIFTTLTTQFSILKRTNLFRIDAAHSRINVCCV